MDTPTGWDMLRVLKREGRVAGQHPPALHPILCRTFGPSKNDNSPIVRRAGLPAARPARSSVAFYLSREPPVLIAASHPLFPLRERTRSFCPDGGTGYPQLLWIRQGKMRLGEVLRLFLLVKIKAARFLGNTSKRRESLKIWLTSRVKIWFISVNNL